MREAVAAGGGPLLILIADDERPIAAVIAALVDDLGYQARVAADGRQALALARAAWPALLITDLMMPGLAGDQLIAALRAEAAARGCPAPPAILLTAAEGARAAAAGADATLPKPFDLGELERQVARLLAAA